MRRFLKIVFKIILMVGLFLPCNEAYTQTVKRITALEFYAFLENMDRAKLTIIDGRDSSMFHSGHIKGAVNIDAFAKNAETKLSGFTDEENLIVYCTNHTRSETIIELLSKSNYQGEIVFVTDGITGWKKNGFDVVAEAPEGGSSPELETPHELLAGLKPIVQVFGTAAYNVENEHYGYSFGRTHLGLQYQFDQNWSAKIIIDRGRSTSIRTITVTDSSGSQMQVQNTSKEGAYYTMFLKFAGLQWKVNDKLAFECGAILQNHYITQERFWGFRYIAQTFQDLYWKIPSSDLGFIAYYKINKTVSVDAALTNGEGPRANQDAFGKVKFAGGIDLDPSEKIQTRLYYHNRQSGMDGLHTEHMFSAFAGYNPIDKFRIGGEFNYMDNMNNTSGLDSYGFSIYPAYQIAENTQLFLRYDRLIYDTDDDVNNTIKGNGNTVMGGVSYSPFKNVSLSLNYQGWLPDDEKNKDGNNILFSMEYKF